ncbi:serine hydrolase [Spirilliplanes yamanashiensis]|uniref:Beta-lactamase-related domain-containing protein n=1 Tax=Spirilliplanes yamanashiensis TaxID=42233 RepID=A0A8J3Y9P3_9ACTN|nr:serine hydrolase [Spirilliplanes yamanashiensis]MDP9815829.1 CubicO group peptidase (beta-lactamase class C family) [Spirilliplanes yamanashiensis]GIJ04084.1 hypothetical protein Sya03_34360 [Spirilliplanes yamanashiensis]
MTHHSRGGRRRALGACLAVVLTSTLGTVIGSAGGPAAAHPGLPLDVFDPVSVTSGQMRDETPAEFETELADYKERGLLPVDVEVDTVGGWRGGATFQRNTDGRTWWLRTDMTEAAYEQRQADAREAGLRQVDIEVYEVDGKRRYAAIWIENKENLASAVRHDLTDAEWESWFEQQRAAGRMPVAIQQYATDEGVRYAGVWVRNPTGVRWAEWRGLSEADFQRKADELESDHRLFAFDSVRTSAGQRYSGIWVENTDGRRWRVQRDLTKRDFWNWINRSSDEGFRPVSYERYETAAGTRYAGIWRQNSARPQWPLRGKVDKLVKAELEATDVPGISVAVMEDGRFSYLRGFGNADVDADGETWLDADHVLGIASVSKAVAGVLTMRLVEQGEVALADRTSAHITDIPKHHTHTIGQLARSRGCVQHYRQGGGFGDDKPYATSRDSAEDFWDDALVCVPGTYNYSTHGYTVLCAALEEATGDDTYTLLEERLNRPFGLGTLNAERLTDRQARRSKIYNDDNEEIERPDRTEKVCGGGMESSVRDLAAFGEKVRSGDILTEASLRELWGNGGRGYRMGWRADDDAAGRRMVWKDGSNEGTQSFLHIYPDDGVVVAVLSNREAGGHDMPKLARDIGALVVSS